MNFKYELTKQDFIDFNLFHILYAKSTRQSYFIRRYIFSLSFLTLPFLLAQFTDVRVEYWLAIFILYYIYWVVFYPKRIKNMVSRKISKMVDRGKTDNVLGSHSLTVSQDSIIDKSEQTEVKTQVSAIHNIVEDKEHIFIYVNEDSAHIIPIKTFLNKTQKQEFQEFLRQRVGQKNYNIL